MSRFRLVAVAIDRAEVRVSCIWSALLHRKHMKGDFIDAINAATEMGCTLHRRRQEV